MRALSSVIVSIRLEDDDLGTTADDEFVERLECAIRERLEADPEIGYWDGHGSGGGWADIFCYGKDGPLLSDTVSGAVLSLHSTRRLCVTNDKRLYHVP